ncbi:hypothetical protein F3Y22_tig00015825pilonHSYRG00003 [Hibiscus syriacus]|uniref:Uncharacterized protein n=1 Tax=Hibiscus syriacus TaxID=106335 RepID=A0A6A3BY38_HIBSY|nr:hypothetical protein F3Y22_tig00015825pilonHSYRG00003 [Hibiscus syriacus]
MALSIDSNHPLFLHPSDTPGVQLVSLQLTGVKNYSLWGRTMRIALLVKNKLGFVDGSCRRDDSPDALQSQWERCNALVLSWILNSVSPDLSDGIVFASYVEAVWKDHKERFDKIDGSRVFFLYRSIATLVQGESSVSVYFTRLKLLWDEYTALVPFSFCDCETAQQNSGQSSLLYDRSGGAASCSTFCLSPIETSVMFTTASKGNERRCFSGTCDYCNIKGHSRDRCYRLIGFPPDFKFNKNKVPPAATMVNSMHAADNDTANGLVVSSTVSAVPSFTSEQYHQILKLLSKSPPSDSSVNLAGTVASNLPTSSNSCVRWIIDTGATDYILSVFKGLQFPVLCYAHRFVHLPNGHTKIVTHVGSHRLNSELVLSNDLCNGMIKGIGRRFNGLYIFESKGATGLISNSLASTGEISSAHSVHDFSVNNKTSLWHARFGHASASAMKKLSSYISDKFDENFVHSCNVCPLAKQTRLPSSVLQWKTPYELLYHKVPDMSILKVFGCLCYATVPKPVDKFSHRAFPFVFMGYSNTLKDISFGQQPVTTTPRVSTSSTELGQSSQQLESPVVPVAPVPVRKSTRIPKKTHWLSDFICNSVSTSSYPISDFISYNHLPCGTQSFVSFISNSVEPKSYHEAIQHPEWAQAMKDEILALEINKTWSVVSLPSGKIPIGCKWFYRIKYTAAGTIERYKARLVAKGYSQKEGVDYMDTFSPVVKLVIVRLLLAIASVFDWPLFQLDVYNAFLQGDLFDEVYMELPPGFCSQGENMVCRLQKSLYGLKQASRQWNLKLTEALLGAGYEQSKFDYSLFTMRKDKKIVVLLIYIDDLLITGNDDCLINDLKSFLNKKFKMKDLGELKYFLGLEVMRSKEGILVNQRKYALELLEESGMSGSKPARTPLEQNVKLTTAEYDELCMKGSNENDELLVDKSVFQRLIGRLIYLTHTRPDITFVVHYLSQFMQQPKESHLRSVLRIVRYIKKSPGQGILMDSNSSCELNAYCDLDWVACPISRSSISGFCIKLGNSLVSWKSKKQNVIARSSAEAEYRSMATTTAGLTWLNGLANELGLERRYPVRLHCDNKVALQIAANPVYHERTKHIEIDCHFVREKIQEGLIKTDFVSSSEQLADIFTKALGVQQHEYLVSKLGVKDVFYPPT